MPFVVDASVALAWCFAGEATSHTIAVRELLRRTVAVAPAILPLQVANALLVGERRQRLTQSQAERALRLLADLPISVEDAGSSTVWGPVLALARQHHLTVYDASYLELAVRQGLRLATQDARLRDAAARTGVRLVTDTTDAT